MDLIFDIEVYMLRHRLRWFPILIFCVQVLFLLSAQYKLLHKNGDKFVISILYRKKKSTFTNQ